MDKNNFTKHTIIIKNKYEIIKKYNEGIAIGKIAGIYGVTLTCISHNLKLWGVLEGKRGIKYLLGKMILELLF